MTFGFKNIGHFFATVVTKVHSTLLELETKAPAIEAGVAKAVDTADAAVHVFAPQYAQLADLIDGASKAALGSVFEAVTKTDAAVTANGVNITLDKDAFDSYKALLAQIEAAFPGKTAIPAYLKTAPVAVPAAA